MLQVVHQRLKGESAGYGQSDTWQIFLNREVSYPCFTDHTLEMLSDCCHSMGTHIDELKFVGGECD